MTGRSISQQAQAQAGSELLKPLFICKVVRTGINPDELLAEYKLALRGMPRFAIERTIEKIRAGVLCQANNFCPLPPELAQMVRDEWAFQRKVDQPKALPAPTQMPAFARMQKRWQDMTPIATDVTLDVFQQGVRVGRWPVGAVFAAILGNVYASQPPAADGERERAASSAVQRYHEKRQQDEREFFRQADIQTDEQRDYWRKISTGLKDNPNMTAEQAAFRQNVEQQIGEA